MRYPPRLLPVLLAMLLPLAGCATGPGLEARLFPFIGRSEGDLVAAFGVPVRTYQADERKFLQYEELHTAIQPAAPYWYPPYGRFGPIFPPPPSYIQRVCEITFTLRHARVESFTFRGDGCR
jgi:hypothetical protein